MKKILIFLILSISLSYCTKTPTPSYEGPCDEWYRLSFDISTWEDINHNGTWNEGEPPLPDVEVNLDNIESIFIRGEPSPTRTDANGSANLDIQIGGPCGMDNYFDTLMNTFSIKVAVTTPPECKLTTPGIISEAPYQFGFWCSGTPSSPPTKSAPTDTPQITPGSPVFVTGLGAGVTAITAGFRHTCALVAGGVKCWGFNYSNQLGNGSNLNRSIPTDVVGLDKGVIAIQAGGHHTCAFTNSNEVICWGDNQTGQLGDGTNITRTVPVKVAGLGSNVVSIAAGAFHTCALMASGQVKCWGDNYSGQLGNGSHKASSTPVDVVGLSKSIISIAAGDFHNCALAADGSVKCWGGNESKQLGDNSEKDRLKPVNVVGLKSKVTVIAAGGNSSFAIMEGGGVKGWGGKQGGPDYDSPVDIVGLDSGIITIAAKYDHACALTANGKVKCWGWNLDGQLGSGTTETHQDSPADAIIIPSTVTSITVGNDHTCALLSDGRVMCFGSNEYDQLGMGAEQECRLPDKKWVSTQSAGDLKTPLIIFEVQNCSVVSVEISAFPVQGEPDYIFEEDISLPIENNQWTYTRKSGEGQLTLVGIFDSEISSSGTLKYTKGYSIFDQNLIEEVKIPWMAVPDER